LADGAQTLNGLELVQHVHRLHGHGEPDAVGQPMSQAVDVGGLAPRDAAVVGIEKAHEADAGSPGLRGQVGTGALGTPGGHGVRRIARTARILGGAHRASAVSVSSWTHSRGGGRLRRVEPGHARSSAWRAWAALLPQPTGRRPARIQMVSFLRQEASVMIVPVFAATQDPSSALDASWRELYSRGPLRLLQRRAVRRLREWGAPVHSQVAER